MAKKKKPEYLGGGIKVILIKEFTEYGVTRPAGTEMTVSVSGYHKLLEGGFIENENKKSNTKQ